MAAVAALARPAAGVAARAESGRGGRAAARTRAWARRARPRAMGMHVPSDSFGGASPEAKGAQAMTQLLTFAASKIILAQLEVSASLRGLAACTRAWCGATRTARGRIGLTTTAGLTADARGGTGRRSGRSGGV